jgi:hypothetical protein
MVNSAFNGCIETWNMSEMASYGEIPPLCLQHIETLNKHAVHLTIPSFQPIITHVLSILTPNSNEIQCFSLSASHPVQCNTSTSLTKLEQRLWFPSFISVWCTIPVSTTRITFEKDSSSAQSPSELSVELI